jgi:hypothetical protein
MFPQYILGPDYLRLPGNNEFLFPLHLALFAFAGAVALLAWRAAGAERLPSAPASRPSGWPAHVSPRHLLGARSETLSR